MKAEKIPVVNGGLPLLGHAIPFMTDPIAFLKKAHKKLGSIFSFKLPGKNVVMLIGPEHNKFVFEQTDKLLSIEEGYTFFQNMFSPDFFYFGGFEAYKKQRDIVLPCFKNTQMPNYLDVMMFETEQFMKSLGTSGSFDLTETFGPLVMKIAAHSFLGKDFKDKIGDSIFEDFRQFSEGMDPVIPGWVPLPKFKRSKKAKEKLYDNLLVLVKERREHPKNPPDFLQTLATSTYPDGEQVPDDVVIDLILLLVWAGHETTAGHISWVLIDLLQNQEYLNSVLEEQQEVISATTAFSMETMKSLKKIEWAIKETERLHPVAYILLRNANVSFERNGFHVPKGSSVFISPALTHQMPEVFNDPEIYNPLRFSEPKNLNYDLIGFGGGLHRCAGVNFAYLEMKLIMTFLLHHYDFELITKKPKPVKGPVTKWPASPTIVSYKKKENVSSITKKNLKEQTNNTCPYH